MDSVPLTEKRCGKCGEVKPLDGFPKDRTRADGLNYRCRACLTAYRAAHKDERNEYRRKWRENNLDRYRAKANANKRARAAKRAPQNHHVITYRKLEREEARKRGLHRKAARASNGFKVCSRCRERKPTVAFSAHRSKADGLYSWCRACVQIANAQPAKKAFRFSYGHAYRVARKAEVRAHRRAAQERKRKERQAKGLVRKWGTNRTPDRVLAQSQRRRALVRGVPHELVLLSVLIERDKARCQLCRKGKLRGDKWSMDHILPISHGGEHTYANTQLAHLSCNLARNNRGAAQLRLLA